MSFLSSASSGMTAWEMGKKQWHMAKREMATKEIQGAEEVRQMQNRLDELEGTQAARYGASGVKSEGSPMDVMLATQREGQAEIDYKKMMDTLQIAEIRRAGRLAKKAGGMAATGSLATGIGNTISSIFGNILGQGANQESAYKMKDVSTGRVSGGGGGGFNTWSLLGSL